MGDARKANGERAPRRAGPALVFYWGEETESACRSSPAKSVDGVAEFTTQDGNRWRLMMDRVQTKDVPHHPRFGG